MKKFIILANFFLTACVGAKIESPVVYISNASPEVVKNIRIDWVKNLLSLPALNPGDSRSQSFYIRSNDDFFGLIKVSWVNSEGNNINREFFFRAPNMPSIDDHTTYNYVQIYLDQYDFEIVSSDAPDLTGKTRRMEQLLTSYREQYAGGHPAKVESALIRVQPKKDTSLPGWLSNSY